MDYKKIERIELQMKKEARHPLLPILGFACLSGILASTQAARKCTGKA